MPRTSPDIGSCLRDARERRGLTLDDIAARTKISIRSLTAMECNDFARLPGGVFRRAYVRAFASEVGLDADRLTGEYIAAFEADRTPTSGRRGLLHRLNLRLEGVVSMRGTPASGGR